MSGCASQYLPPPSRNTPASAYTREQIKPMRHFSAAGFGESSMVGVLAALTGPFALLVLPVGTFEVSKHERHKDLTAYWQQIDDTELVGAVVQDVTKFRNQQFHDHPKWFKNLPPPTQLPQEVSVDCGSGNLFQVPVRPGVRVSPGDIVTVMSPATVDHLINTDANFYKDQPWVVAVRCQKGDTNCAQDPANQEGIARKFISPAVFEAALASYRMKK